MDTITTTSKFSWKDFPKLLLAVLAVTIICLLFPSHEAPSLKYAEGSTWAYTDLVAEREHKTIIETGIVGDSLHPYKKVTFAFKPGDVIISKNQKIRPNTVTILDEYLGPQIAKSGIFSAKRIIYFIGYFLLTALIIGALLIYAAKYFPEIFKSIRGVLFLLVWPVIFSLLVFLVNQNNTITPYLIPFCLVPIIVYNFYGGRLALVVHIVVVLIASFLSGLGYEFTFLQILAGIVTVLVISETRYWNKFFTSILIIMGTYLIGYLGLALINSGSLVKSEYQIFGWLAINCLLLLLAYPFIPIIEKIFGFTSSITLAELSDMNKPLIKELSIKAPGTLQHSLQVANLGEAAAERIGANSLLVKTAALYHDIGKLKKPEYFIENAKGENNHASLSNFESAEIIINHVIDGDAMAKKARLPKLIRDIIKTHHGTTRVEYFYRKQKADEPDREFDESIFRYPGPKPTTKEQTILMLADSIEAASKSLKNPTGQDIDKLIEGITEYKVNEGQLSDSALSFHELDACKDVFRSLLRSIYHVRIEYPEEQKS